MPASPPAAFRRLLAALAAASVALLVAAPARADRMALWNIVHGQCVPHVQAGQGPAPCVSVDLSGGEDHGVALLKDLHGVAQMLAIPTRRVTGIEDPFVLTPEAPNYFAYAWSQLPAMEAKLGRPLPRASVGVAINSMFSRSQDQLHLHLDCLDREVAAQIADYGPSFDETFRPMTVALKGRHYWARRIDYGDLAAASPFQRLAEGIEGARLDMGLWTLALVGADFSGRPGYVLLADHAELTAGGHSEDIMDHDCAIAQPKP